MSISINCPTCGKSYNLNESMAGKKVRCKHCADTFPVELDEVVPVRGDTPGAGAVRQVADDASAALPEVRPAPDRDGGERSLREPREERKEPAKSGGFPWGWCIAGGGVCLVLLLCGGIVTGIFLIVYNVVKTANNISNNLGAMAANNPANLPQTPATALADLQSNDFFRKQRALQYLAQTPSNPTDQPRVARALDPLLTDSSPFIKGDAAAALVNWGDTNSVPGLIRCVEIDDPNCSDTCVKALVRIRDQRGVAAIARLLANDWKRNGAVNALQSLGPMCEAEVLKYAFDPNNGARSDALRLLKGYGTKDAVILPQALAELKGNDSNRRSAAAAWLTQTKVVEARRNEVATALDPVLRDPNPQVRSTGVSAARVWGTKENVPALINFVNDTFVEHRPPEQTWQVIEMLIAFKDERAYWPIARYTGHPFEHARGRTYLQQIGSAAEPEVVKKLTDPSNTVRQTAWKALTIVGVKANLTTYQNAEKAEMDGFAKILARDALSAIAAR